jgi:hypothetical protein
MSDETFAQTLASGVTLQTPTLAGLVDQLDIDKTAALASIERYNTLAANGKDEDFNKPAARMFRLDKPPYYASTLGIAAMLVCIGGIESDEEAHGYGENLRVIPGLYTAGNVQGNRFAVEYPICMKGISHSMAMFYGYIAGQNAAAGV